MTKLQLMQICKELATALVFVKFVTDDFSKEHKIAKDALDKYFNKISEYDYLEEVKEAEAL